MKKNAKSGSSLVSVIVAFAVLMIGIAMFTTTMLTSLKAAETARLLRQEGRQATENYYLGGSGARDPYYDSDGSGNPILFRLKAADGSDFVVSGEVMTYTENKGEEEEYALYYFAPPPEVSP